MDDDDDGGCGGGGNNNETRIRFTAPFYDVGVYRTATRKHFMVYRLPLLLLLFPFLESVAA